MASGSALRSRLLLRVMKPAEQFIDPSTATAGSIQVSVASGSGPAAPTARRPRGWSSRGTGGAPRTPRGGASLRNTIVRTSSGASVIAATSSRAPCAASRPGSAPVGRPAGHVNLDALPAQVGRGPAVHHPLVADQAAYGPLGQVGTATSSPAAWRGARTPTPRRAGRRGAGRSSGWWARREASTPLAGACGYRPCVLTVLRSQQAPPVRREVRRGPACGRRCRRCRRRGTTCGPGST